MLQYASQEELEQRSIGEVGYLQLFRQSKEYRGKLVTIRGRARQAYSVAAPQNDFGIKSYQVFWVRAEGGVNSPIVVYAAGRAGGVPRTRTAVRHGGRTHRRGSRDHGLLSQTLGLPGEGRAAACAAVAGEGAALGPPAGGIRPLVHIAVAGDALRNRRCVAAAVIVSIYVYRTSRASGLPPLFEAPRVGVEGLGKGRDRPHD